MPTPRDYLTGHHAVQASCRHCDHTAVLDMPALIAAGQGDTPVVDLPLRCRQCGRLGRWITVQGIPWVPLD